MSQLRKSTLGRKKAPKKALILQATNALIQHKRIITTKTKAKMIARYIAPLISNARRHQETNPLHAKRQTFSRLRHKKTTQILLKEILPQIGPRPGGYTRIITLPKRPGDAATTAMIELVDYNLLYKKKTTKTKTTRRGLRKKHNPLNQGKNQEAPPISPIIKPSQANQITPQKQPSPSQQANPSQNQTYTPAPQQKTSQSPTKATPPTLENNHNKTPD